MLTCSSKVNKGVSKFFREYFTKLARRFMKCRCKFMIIAKPATWVGGELYPDTGGFL